MVGRDATVKLRLVGHFAVLLATIAALSLFHPKQAIADTLKVECDVEFQVETFLNENTGSYYLATVSRISNFPSYWLSIDWDKKTANVYDVAPTNESKPVETYQVASEKDWPLIELNKGTGSTFTPILFYIRRASGWFMQQKGNPDHKDTAGNPVVDIIEVGVCGGQPKF